MATKKSSGTTYPVQYLNVINKCVYTAKNATEEAEYKDNSEYEKVS